MKLILVGPGAFGAKHLDALSNIDGAEVVSIVGPDRVKSRELADRFGIEHIDDRLDLALQRKGVNAAIITSPTHLHTAQAIECLDAGKHVAVEIPAGDTLQDVERLAAKQLHTGLVCMVGHTRRYHPSHQWIHKRVQTGKFKILHMDVQTFFFRRANTNAQGEPRDWTDHLLWHHAAHTVDLFQYQIGEAIENFSVMQGPLHPDLGIALDMSIQMRTVSRRLLTLTLSFNNRGPLGTVFRYIGDTGTYIAKYDELITGNDDQIDVSGIDISNNGIELQDRDFLYCIRDGCEPRASIKNVLPCYRLLKNLEDQINLHSGV